MAVEDDSAFFPTEAIISQNARKHYRLPVRSQHWQLRSLISAEKEHIVYFPGGKSSHFVQRLNTATHECETLKLLAFAPRCLVADNGWLCCGSESGDFVAIRVDEGGDRAARAEPGTRAEPGQSSQTNPTTQTPQTPQTPPTTQAPEATRRLEVEAEAEAEEMLEAEEDDSSPSTPAIDSGRDVRRALASEELLSLLAQTHCTANKPALAKSMKLAKARVNCITLWFPPTDFPADDKIYAEPVAVLANNDQTVTLVSLRDFEANDKVDPLEVVSYPDYVNRAIISPNGRLMVAILDDPFLYVHQRVEVPPEGRHGSSPRYRWELKQSILLKSQRKDDKTESRGSFAACFSSSGFHLAVGTQHGTISIFNTTLLTQSAINPLITTFTSSRPDSAPGAIRDMEFCPGPYDLLAWTEDRGHVGVADVRSNYMVRQIVDINVEAGFEHISVLDRNIIEPRLLQEAIRLDQLRRDPEITETIFPPLYRPRDPPPRPEIEERTRRLPDALRFPYRAPTTEGDAPRPQEVSIGGARPTGGRGFSDLRERLRDRERNAARDWREGPRVQAALRELRDQRSRPDPNYETVLEILFAREPNVDAEMDDSSILVPFVNQVVNRWEESAIRGTLTPDHGVFEGPPSPDNTAGVAWSQDGRTLYVGAQNGIYEFKVNTHSRKFCPSIGLR